MAKLIDEEKSQKRTKTFFKILFIFLIFAYFCSLYNIDDDYGTDKLADGFSISAYDIVLDVNENNVIDVTENITVDWYEKNHHGIYKFTPEWLKYTGKDGKTIKRKSIVSNYRANGDHYTVDKVNNKPRIKIGNPNLYTGLGEKTYSINYTYNMGSDPFENFDEFIFHAYGDYWGTEIKNASIQINMPKSIEKENINFFLDKYRKENANDYMDLEVINNTIYARFNETKYYESQKREYCKNKDSLCDIPAANIKKLTKSLTIDIELPEGYFVNGSWNYGYASFILCLIIFAITIINYFIWAIYGKNLPKRLETVEFYPPENYSSAEIGFIYAGESNKKLTISLIIELASKGYIKIDELNDKEKNIKITNLITDAKNEKLNNLKPLEKIVYDKLFEETNEIILSEHKTLYEAFTDVDTELNTKLKDLVNDKKATKKMYISIFITILTFILYVVSYNLIEDLDPKFSYFYVISVICIFVNLILSLIMKRRTEYGEQIIAKVKGFRNFLVTAEKDKLEALVEKNPYYFYDILPYTYVLNVSKKWIKKFENIPMPEVNMGNYNYGDIDSYNYLYSSVYSPSSSSGSGSGGCSSGGGCGGCGGGGSW